jgi:hypothetical protein
LQRLGIDGDGALVLPESQTAGKLYLIWTDGMWVSEGDIEVYVASSATK